MMISARSNESFELFKDGFNARGVALEQMLEGFKERDRSGLCEKRQLILQRDQ
ncbi:hypothetical protein D3C86_2111110 [compost metagenome]